MRRPTVVAILSSALLFGALALAPSGCSTDGNASSPTLGATASGPMGYPPAMPTGLVVAKRAPEGIKFAWDPNTEDDLAGYRLYIYQPSPYRSESYSYLNGVELIPKERTSYLCCEGLTVGWNYFKLAAVDTEGYESLRYGPYEFSYSGGLPAEPGEQDRSGGDALNPQFPGQTPEGVGAGHWDYNDRDQ